MGLRVFKLIGWLTDSNNKYWIATNSFSKNWGITGYVLVNQ